MDRKILSFQVLTVAVRKIQVSTELPCPQQMTLFLPWLVPPAAVTMARVSLQAVTLWVLLKDTLMLLKTQEKCAKLSKSNDRGACYHSWRPSVGLLRKFYYVAPRCEVNAGVMPKETDTKWMWGVRWWVVHSSSGGSDHCWSVSHLCWCRLLWTWHAGSCSSLAKMHC